MKMKFAIISVLLITLLAIFGWLSLQKGSTKEIEMSKAKNCPKQAPNYLRCNEDFFAQYANKYGAVRALTELSRETRLDPMLKGACHGMMHEIGHAAAQEYGNVGTAFLHGNNECQNGYYHGVIEKLLEQETLVTLTREHVESICDRKLFATSTEYLHINCIHGIGHALMFVSDNDAASSLLRCAELSPDRERAECATGVLMEEGFIAQQSTSIQKALVDPTLICSQALGDQDGCWLAESAKVISRKENGGGVAAIRFCNMINSPLFKKSCIDVVEKRI